MQPRSSTVLVALTTLLVLVRSETPAFAEKPDLETADGPSDCHDFEDRNHKELRQWVKEQPPVPFERTEPDEVLNAPWGPFISGTGQTIGLLAATLLPHVGAQIRADVPSAVISWPLAIPFGPAFACSRKRGTFDLKKHRLHRFLVEPGFFTNDRAVGAFVRPGYRFIYHPTDWVVGIGAGVGSTLEAGGGEPKRASLSPEFVFHFGRCCDNGYFTLAIRYDRYFAGTFQNAIGGSLGFVYF